MTHPSSCCIQETDVAGLLPCQGSLTSVTSLRMVLRQRMKSPTEKDEVCVAMFPDLYLIRWLSRFLKRVPKKQVKC